MKSLSSLSLWLAASAALVSATASPHGKHEKYKRSLPVSKPAKVAPRAKLTSKYLTNTTACMFYLSALLCFGIGLY
jgi:hypothetical protein